MNQEDLWLRLGRFAALSAFGFYIALTTKLPSRNAEWDRARIVYHLLMYAKVGGWIFAIGGVIGVIKMLLILVNAHM